MVKFQSHEWKSCGEASLGLGRSTKGSALAQPVRRVDFHWLVVAQSNPIQISRRSSSRDFEFKAAKKGRSEEEKIKATQSSSVS